MILVIDDDVVAAHIITAVLKRGRSPHLVAPTAAAARELVMQHPVDLIICDMDLPDGDGLDLVEEFMVRPHLQDIPVVFCTATPDLSRVERALGLGAVDVLKKPIDVDRFGARVDRALTRAPARWAPWHALARRCTTDGRSHGPALRAVRDDLAALLELLALSGGDGPPRGDLHARVMRLREAAAQVGALRTAKLIDALWSGTRARDAADLHDALVPELRAFDHALVSRASMPRVPAAHPRP